MADKNFKVKNGLDIGDNVSTYVTRVVINSAAETTIDSVLTGTTESVEYSLTLYQGAGVVAKKYLAVENGAGSSTQEYASSSVSRAEYSGVWNWTTQTSNFGSTRIMSVAYGNSLWVAAGYYGQLRTSTDATTWTTRTSNFGNTTIFSVAYGNNLWVAAGYYGQLRTSTDAITWTTRTSNFTQNYLGTIYSVAFGNNLWVAGGGNSELRTSTDAITWTTQASNFDGNWIFSIAYGNNLWVAAGMYGNLRTSTDGITWTTGTSNFGNTNIRSIAYGNSLWVAAGEYSQLRTSAVTTASVLVPLTLSADISGSDVRLRATITDAATTNAEVKVLKTVL